MTGNKFQGKRAELGVYDDAWIHGDDSVECIVKSPRLLSEKIESEMWSKIADKINSIGCMSFTLTAEQIQSIANQFQDNSSQKLYSIYNNTELMECNEDD